MNTKGVVMSTMLALSFPLSSGATDKLDVGIVTAGALDLGVTEWALHRNSYLSEGNPLGPTPAVRVTGKTLTTVGIVVVRGELKKRGHRRSAKVIGIAAMVLWGGAAVNNYRLGREK